MTERLTSSVSVFAGVVLCVTAGAMLAEAAVMVPYWQSLPAAEFFEWYAANAARLVAFYSPLEISSAVVSLSCAILYSVQSRAGAGHWWVATAFSLIVIGMFFVYFKDANASFLERTLPEDAVPTALVTWGRWQWGRVAAGLVASVAGVVAVRQTSA